MLVYWYDTIQNRTVHLVTNSITKYMYVARGYSLLVRIESVSIYLAVSIRISPNRITYIGPLIKTLNFVI